MITLIQYFEERYGKLVMGIPDITVGEYELKNYFMFDNQNAIKVLYFNTTSGMYKTTSKNLIHNIIFNGIGKLLQEQFDKGETVLVEIINQRKKNGKFGLAFRTV